MGAQQVKSGHSDTGHLNEDERKQLKLLFERIGRIESIPNQNACSINAFKKHCEAYLDDWLLIRILSNLKVKKDATEFIPLDGFLLFVSTVLKGDLDERVSVLSKLCAGGKELRKVTSGDDILKYTISLIASFGKVCTSMEQTKSWGALLLSKGIDKTPLAYYLLTELLYPVQTPKDLIIKDESASIGSREFTYDELITGLTKSMLFQNISNTVYSQCFDFSKESNVTKNLIPYCLHASSAVTGSNFSLLDLNRVLFLNSLLTPEFRSKWRFLFSTACHGESFSKCLSCIQEKGSTILIIRDNHDRIFGGFAPSSWKLGPKFFGTSDSFLFHLSPRLIAYPVTGYNQNFQYLNIQQKTLPNGLGMGGALEYFAIWIDAEFGKGVCSPTCTTYVSPQLSQEKEFTISHLEVWGVGPEPQKEEGIREPQSVLDKDPELRAVMELMGKKTNASDGYRDDPTTE